MNDETQTLSEIFDSVDVEAMLAQVLADMPPLDELLASLPSLDEVLAELDMPDPDSILSEFFANPPTW